MVKINKLFIVIVAYNKSIGYSFSNNLPAIDYNNYDVSFITVDNSTDKNIKNENYLFCINNDICYIDAKGNTGLSVAYNTAIKEVANRLDSSVAKTWIMTLDQDTKVSNVYLKNILDSINAKKSYPIKTGIIRFDGYIGSPLKISLLQPIVKVRNIWSNVECINSCLTLRLDVLQKVGLYDERLFLDQVDRMILFKLRKIGFDKIEIVNGDIKQDFSGDIFSNKKSDSYRFGIYLRDTLRYIYITKDRIIGMLFSIEKRWLHIRLHYLREVLLNGK